MLTDVIIETLLISCHQLIHFRRGERGIPSDLNRSTYNMAHITGMIHMCDPAKFCGW